MSELSARLSQIKGQRQTKEIIESAGISRETFRRIERGETVKRETLREISNALGATREQWLDLLAAWLMIEAGQDAPSIWIEPKASGELKDATRNQTALATMLFQQLNAEERQQVMKAMQRKEVLSCLPAINQVWEKFNES